MKRFLASIALTVMIAATAWAQAPAPAPPTPAAPMTYASLRNPMIDGAIFVLLAGGAVFAACRPSSRV